MDIERADLRVRARRRRYAWIAAAVATPLILLILVRAFEPDIPTVARSELLIDTVKRGDFVQHVRGTGTLEPKDIRWITSEGSARVERVRLKPGARVSADTVVLELTDPQVENLLLTANAALIEARSVAAARQTEWRTKLLDDRGLLAKARTDVEVARAQVEAERAVGDAYPKIQLRKDEITLAQYEALAALEHERVQSSEQNVQHQLDAEKARVDQVVALRDLRQRQKDALQVRAGIDGILDQVSVQEGQQVSQGTNMARVTGVGQFLAKLHIAETQAKDIAPGQKAMIDLRSAVVAGTVLRVDPAIHEGSVEVDIELEGEVPAAARSDLSVDGTIEVQRVENALYVGAPAASEAESEGTVFRYDPASGFTERRKVTLGRGSVDQIEVLTGLNEGDQVIISDTSRFASHERVRLR